MSHDEMPEEELWERTQSEDLSDRADSLQELGQRRVNEENYEMAKSLFGSAADLFTTLERELDLTRSIYSVGYCQYRLNEHDEAVKTLTDALARSKELSDSRSIAYSAGPLADCYAYLGEDDKAIQNYDLAVDAFEEIEEPFNAGVNCLSMGELHGKNARQTRALACFIRAYNIFQGSGDATGAARAKDRMAAALIELGDLDQATMHLRDALLTFEHMQLEDRVAYAQYRLGWTHVLNSKYNAAIAPLRSAIAYYRENKDWSNAAVVELQLASALRLLDPETPNQESEVLLARLAAYFESAGEVSNALSVESINGEKLFESGAFDAAAAVFGDIVSRAEEIGDHFVARQARASQVEALFKAGRMTEAKEVFAEINPSDWGENNVELDRIEKLTKLMLDTMAMTLNVEV